MKKNFLRRIGWKKKVFLNLIEISLLGLMGKLGIFSRLIFSYNSVRIYDGVGAQFQRSVSVFALSRYLRTYYIFEPIKQLTIHPLDNLNNEKDYKKFLERANLFFDLAKYSKFPEGKRISIKITQLKSLHLIKYAFLSKVGKAYVELKIEECNSLFLSKPQLISHIASLVRVGPTKPEPIAVVHYRQGNGKFTTYPGQKIPRQIPVEKYHSRLGSIVQKLKKENHSIKSLIIVTDSPKVDFEFVPLPEQVKYWEGDPGFQNGKIKIWASNFEDFYLFDGLKPTIYYGGDPLKSFEIIMKAKIILIGRSSFSYLAALLNPWAEVYYPNDFWYRPLSGWKRL